MFLEQALADFGIVNAVGHARGVEGPEAVGGGDVHAHSHGFDAGDEGLVIAAMALPAVLDTFFANHGQGFSEGAVSCKERGVMIFAFAEIGVEEAQVHVEGVDGYGALAEALPGARGVGERGESGGTAKTFLGATVGDVDTGFVDAYGHAAEGGDAVGDDQGVDLVGGFADGMAGLEGAGGGLGLHVGDGARFFAADEVAGFLVVEDFAPRFFKANDGCAVAAGYVRKAVAEVAVGEDGEFLAGLYEIGDGGFHAAGAGAGDGDIKFVDGREGIAEKAADILDDFEEVG